MRRAFFDALNEAIRREIERVGKTMDEKDGS
ncbi:nucleotidyltransferase [Geobacillus subterraneus]